MILLLTQATINSIAIVAGFVVVSFYMFRRKIKNWFWDRFSPIRKLQNEVAKHKRHMAKALDDELLVLEKLKLYEVVETAVGLGFWDWEMSGEWDTIKGEDDVVKCSPNFLRIFEADGGRQITGRDLINCILEHDRQRVTTVIEKAMEKGESYSVEYEIGRRNHSTLKLRCWGFPVLTKEKEFSEDDEIRRPTRYRGAVQIIS